MAIKKVLGTLTGSGIKVSVGGATDVQVGPKAFVDSDDNYAIFLTGSNQTLTIEGTVRSSGDDTIKFGDAETDKNHVVIVEKTGVVIGDNDDTLSFASLNPTVINKGLVIGLYPVYIYNDLNTLVKVNNSGTIIATSSSAVSVYGEETGTAQITNSGKIYAYDSTAVNSNEMMLKLVNTGSIISASDESIYASSVNDSVVNNGKLVGDVVLSLGNDLYDGRLGLIVGEVLGGDGNDRIFGGNRAETLTGEGGNDRIQGGGGKDLLTGGDGNDSFVFTKLSERGDTISDFGAVVDNDDRILISAANFGAGLTKGTLAASKFQARTDNVAQDGNDRFILNLNDGGLWFDKDGSGSAKAVLLAYVPMVALTAADIVII
jgi:Ca2+-binding RTX toxin-like protein